jgi:mono/diheme cytochrome c family protein
LKSETERMSVDSNRPLVPAAAALDRGEATDVVQMHAAVQRERPEPVEGSEPLNLWLVVFIAAILFWAGSYLTQYSGGFRADEFSERQINPAPPASSGGGGSDDPVAKAVKAGAPLYATYCSPCHQGDGNGVAGQFPPLAGSEWVLAEGPNRIIRIVLHGLAGPITVKGSVYNNQMNAFRDSMDDQQIANVLTYIRNSWGNKAGAVTGAEVAAIRGATAARTDPWSAAELEGIAESGGAGAADGPVAPAALTAEQIKDALKALPADDLKALLKELGN